MVTVYQGTWHPVPDTCTLDTHDDEKQNLIYVNTLIYKQHFCQLNLHDMCQSRVEIPALPPKSLWTIKLTAVVLQWLLKSFWTVNQWCSFDYKFIAAYLVKKFLLLWKLNFLYHVVTTYFSKVDYNSIFQYMRGTPKLSLPCNYQNISRFHRSIAPPFALLCGSVQGVTSNNKINNK